MLIFRNLKEFSIFLNLVSVYFDVGLLWYRFTFSPSDFRLLLQHRANDFAYAALEFAVIGYRRTQRGFGGNGRGNAARDELRGINQKSG